MSLQQMYKKVVFSDETEKTGGERRCSFQGRCSWSAGWFSYALTKEVNSAITHEKTC